MAEQFIDVVSANKFMNEPLEVSTNYNLTLMTLFGGLSGLGVAFLIQDIFLTASLTKILLVAIAASILWIFFYIIKNHQESDVQVKEVLVLMGLLLISGGLVWYKLPPLVDFTIPLPMCLIWLVSFAVVYKIESSLMDPEGDVDVFNKGTVQHGTDQRIAFHDIPKKQILNEEVAFHIDNDGLDLQIIFNIENTGAIHLLKVDQISDNAKLKDYLLKQNLIVNELNSIIDGAMLIEIQLGESIAYYQILENFSYEAPDELPSINIALLDESEALNKSIETALREMLVDYPAESVKKYNTKNYQAVFKFYDYVKKLNKKENCSIDYISFYHGRFEISNSEFVELYNCNLHSTLISWVNKDGLIRTDYVDEEEELLTPSEKEALQTIVGLPYLECRLIDIKLLKLSKDNPMVKLYLTFAELDNHVPTGKQESLTLSAKGKDILISSEPQEEADLITIDEYFDAKTLIPFVIDGQETEELVQEVEQIVLDTEVPELEMEALVQETDVLLLDAVELVPDSEAEELVQETEILLQDTEISELDTEELVLDIDVQESDVEEQEGLLVIDEVDTEKQVEAIEELLVPEIEELESEFDKLSPEAGDLVLDIEELELAHEIEGHVAAIEALEQERKEQLQEIDELEPDVEERVLDNKELVWEIDELIDEQEVEEQVVAIDALEQESEALILDGNELVWEIDELDTEEQVVAIDALEQERKEQLQEIDELEPGVEERVLDNKELVWETDELDTEEQVVAIDALEQESEALILDSKELVWKTDELDTEEQVEAIDAQEQEGEVLILDSKELVWETNELDTEEQVVAIDALEQESKEQLQEIDALEQESEALILDSKELVWENNEVDTEEQVVAIDGLEQESEALILDGNELVWEIDELDTEEQVVAIDALEQERKEQLQEIDELEPEVEELVLDSKELVWESDELDTEEQVVAIDVLEQESQDQLQGIEELVSDRKELVWETDEPDTETQLKEIKELKLEIEKLKQ